MPTLDNAPLLEAIFELRWGEVEPGQFQYSQDEQSLFAGRISAAAASKGYKLAQMVGQGAPAKLPMIVGHRFRMQENAWPVYQVGLGIFTVNQVDDGYDWTTFKAAIKTGLEMYCQAEPTKLDAVKNTLKLVLRYQDAFYPPEECHITEYLEKHFNVKAGLPDTFLDSDKINRNKSRVNININTDSTKPKGEVIVIVASAIINGKPGLLMETVVESEVKKAIGDVVNTDSILEWTETAHDLQRHSFKTLINPSAYK